MLLTTNILTAVVTAYITTGKPCSDGHLPVVGKTIAAPRSVPLGSLVLINDHTFLAEDRTARRFNGRFDIFVATKNEAIKFGKKTLTIKIITIK